MIVRPLLLVALFIADPATTQSVGIVAADDLFETALRDERIAHNVRDETAFVSFGYDREQKKWNDPPAHFLDRFADVKEVIIKPVSEARLPKPGEMDGQRIRGVEDPKRGCRGRIFYCEIMKSLSPTEVELEVGFHGGALYGGGTRAVYQRRDGRWVRTKIVGSFVE